MPGLTIGCAAGLIALLNQTGILILGKGFGVLMVVLWLSFFGWVLSMRLQDSRESEAQTPEELLEREAYKLTQRMYLSLDKRRLHRDLDPTACAVLDESARHYLRIMASLEGPYWSSAALPAHWHGIRDQARTAADQAMRELFVLFKSAVPESPGKWTLEEVVGEVVNTFSQKSATPPVHIPPEFLPARDVAEKLKLLASAVEQSTAQVIQDQVIVESFTAASALDRCLGEIRHVQDAETELRQNISQR